MHSFSGLDEEVSDRDLAIIARKYLTDWVSLRSFLGLTRRHEKEISKSCPSDYGAQKWECLEMWKEMKGEKATYRALILAAEDAKLQELADKIRELLMKRQTTHTPSTIGLPSPHHTREGTVSQS